MCSHFMCWVPEERAKSDADFVCAPLRQPYQKDFKIRNILKEFFFEYQLILYIVFVLRLLFVFWFCASVLTNFWSSLFIK